MFAPGQPLSAAAAAALNELVREWRQYGFKLGVTSWPLTVHRAGRAGQIVGIDPKAFPAPIPDYIVNICPEVTADGCPTGRLWVTWADADGNTSCEVTECDSCVGELPAGCDAGGSGSDITLSDDEPTAPADGDLWIDLGEEA